MKRIMFLGLMLVAIGVVPAFAGQRTVTLAIDHMTCAACPYIVKQALTRVPGVVAVNVSYEKKSAIVTYDDQTTNEASLIAATTNAGYPSHAEDNSGG